MQHVALPASPGRATTRRAAPGHTAGAVRPLIVYLDQSDLSYLALRSGPHGIDAGTRARVQRLSEQNVLRVRTSIAHLTEAQRLGRRKLRALVGLLRELPHVSFVRNYPHEIWAAELEGRIPALEEVPIAATTPMFWASFVLFTALSRPALALEAVLRRAIKEELQRPRAVIEPRLVDALMQDDMRVLFDPGRRDPRPGLSLRSLLLFAFQRRAWRWLRRHGHDHPLGVFDAYRKGDLGFGHLHAQVRAHRDTWGSPGRAASMPACALGVAIKRSLGGDGGRLYQASDEIDVYHAAYAAYSDVATTDRRVFDATKRLRTGIERLRWWWRSGYLNELLDAIEAGQICPRSR